MKLVSLHRGVHNYDVRKLLKHPLRTNENETCQKKLFCNTTYLLPRVNPSDPLEAIFIVHVKGNFVVHFAKFLQQIRHRRRRRLGVDSVLPALFLAHLGGQIVDVLGVDLDVFDLLDKSDDLLGFDV